jgi:hypothetical protein
MGSVAGASLLVLCGVGTGVYVVHARLSASPFSAEASRSAGLPLYYPAKLPDGWRIDPGSLHTDTGMAYYQLANASNIINVTLQTRPSSFNFNNFYTETLHNTTQFLTPLGQAAIGKADGHYLGSLAIDDIWILVTPGSPDLPADDLHTILSNMRRPPR